MNTAHTPGPWHVGGIRPDSQPIVYRADGFAIADATVYHTKHGAEEARANAALIAAAPDLLAALRGAVSYYPEDIDAGAEISGADLLEWFAIWRESALAAIAKAEGRS